MDPAIGIDRLSKRYGSLAALDNLTLEIDRSEIFGFLGHNGAGKTTTINILTTLLAPTSGSASICGCDVVADSMKARQHIGYVPENVRLYDSMTARDNLLFFARLSGVREPSQRIGEVLAILDCPELATKRVGDMSKGQRQRIGLAQAILHRPDVLFLDEPTSGLDPLGIKTLRDLIVKLNRTLGMTIFMNTHLISEVSKTCTSIGVLNHGRLAYRDTIAGVLARFGDDQTLEELYLSLTPAAAA
ncbi:MAG: ABC transporter ATP-binding protein [Rhizobiales bacterium]|nr:ABC transporter ATP-binding protein [Hyphomicrobiales bacterium]MBI3702703.1 ABC transporter ATP-binding protein [Hyphomicrobiales bacterium]